jgi:hypothetical protein
MSHQSFTFLIQANYGTLAIVGRATLSGSFSTIKFTESFKTTRQSHGSRYFAQKSIYMPLTPFSLHSLSLSQCLYAAKPKRHSSQPSTHIQSHYNHASPHNLTTHAPRTGPPHPPHPPSHHQPGAHNAYPAPPYPQLNTMHQTRTNHAQTTLPHAPGLPPGLPHAH